MGEPRKIKDLLKDELMSGESFEEQKENFDYEMAVRLAVDTFRMSLQMQDKNGIIRGVGAMGALGIELEDCKFVKPSDLNFILMVMS